MFLAIFYFNQKILSKANKAISDESWADARRMPQETR